MRLNEKTDSGTSFWLVICDEKAKSDSTWFAGSLIKHLFS